MNSSTPILQGNSSAQPVGRFTRILFLAANPPDTTRLQLDEEIHSIRQALSRTYYRDQFEMIFELAVRVDDLQDLLLRYTPNIVHFSGHASPSSELVLVHEDGSAQPVNSTALADLFRILKENIRCVVLNACFSAAQAQAIGQHIDVVVGISNAILDKASIGFATAFYRALGYGRNVKVAFDLGCSEIDLRGLPDVDRPQIVAIHGDAAQITFAGPQHRQSEASPSSATSPPPPVQDDNRTVMLKRVDRTWIAGVLERSLQGKAALNLRFEEWPDALHDPWSGKVKFLPPQHRPLPFSNDILAVFKAADSALLILGEPGAGKTTLMLLLAKAAVDRARLDPTQSIPVVLHLASWPAADIPLAQWVEDELREKYLMPSAIAQDWVKNNRLFCLFDGLDEVNEPIRAACVQAINEFCKEQAMPIVVCSRAVEYLALPQRLQLNQAVYICLLTVEQINQYVRESGTEHASMAELLRTDEALAELVQTPFMLDVLSTAYRNLPVDVAAGSLEARRHDVLAAYVKTMYKYHRKVQIYSTEQTNYWLGWLACRLQEHSQVEFLIEHLQPTWLATLGQRMLYHISTRLTGCLMMFMTSMLAGLIGSPFLGGSIFTGFYVGVQCGVLFVLAFLIGSVAGVLVHPAVCVVITMVLASAFTYVAPILASAHNLFASLLVGVVFGVPGGLAGASIANLETIYISDRLTLSWPRVWYGVALSTSFFLSIGIMNRIFMGDSLAYVLKLSLDVWVVLAPTLILVWGLSRSKFIDRTVYPNQGIWRSARNAIIPAFGVAVFSVFAGIVVSIILHRPLLQDIGAGLILGLPIGVVMGLVAGGSACIQHVILRVILGFSHQFPWNVRRFMDHTVDLAFVHRSGGTYLFVHRLLRDYFSALKGDPIQ